MAEIPESHRDLLDRPLLLSLSVILPSGQPQVTPVWTDYADGHVRVNTARGRAKANAMEARPQVTGLVIDPDNPFRWIEIRGRVADATEADADAHIDKLAKDYLGVDVYPGHTPDETRVIFHIEPTRVVTSG